MNHRMSTIWSLATYSADKTEIIDLKMRDPITALIFDLEAHNSAAGSMSHHPLACFTKIELVDGSDVLLSLNGRELEAIDWYENKGFRSNYNYALAGGYVCRFVGYQFGRKLWDPELAFDPSKFRNPQLKITMDIDGGGLAPTYNKMGIWALAFDEKQISPMGFLMAKEVKDYVMASSGHEYTDLPLDYPYRRLFLRQQYETVEPNQLIQNLKLSEDHDKKIPYNHLPEDILRSIMAQWPQVRESYFFADAAATRTLAITPTTRVTGLASEWALAASGHTHSIYNGDGGLLNVIANAGGDNIQVEVAGWLPHGVWAIPFGDQDDIEDWYDVTGLGNLEADVHAASGASSSHRAQIITQQLRKY